MSKTEVDTYVLEIVWQYLAAPDTYEALTAGQDEAGQELVQVRGDLAHARHELETLRAKVGAGSLSVAAYAVAEPMMLQRISDMAEAERRLCTPSRLHGLVGADGDVWQRWERMPLSAQREALALLLSQELIGELHLIPIPARRDQAARSPQARLRFKRADQMLAGRDLPSEV